MILTRVAGPEVCVDAAGDSFASRSSRPRSASGGSRQPPPLPAPLGPSVWSTLSDADNRNQGDFRDPKIRISVENVLSVTARRRALANRYVNPGFRYQDSVQITHIRLA